MAGANTIQVNHEEAHRVLGQMQAIHDAMLHMHSQVLALEGEFPGWQGQGRDGFNQHITEFAHDVQGVCDLMEEKHNNFVQYDQHTQQIEEEQARMWQARH